MHCTSGSTSEGDKRKYFSYQSVQNATRVLTVYVSKQSNIAAKHARLRFVDLDILEFGDLNL